MNHEYDSGNIIYSNGNYIIIKVKSGKRIGYIVYNTKREWNGNHTHLKSYSMAKTIINNVIYHKKPKTKNLYLLQSHIRLSDDEGYIQFIENLINVTKNKGKKIYINRQF